ncbi:winged helix-turn-helix transcriptional regulator [Agrilactobacillus fermenti]|uniref:winged helix-turn-helix transcriptional regulator n=1 Tax=Agrilactobacillus fermenti TaxID=2586909 RepID=UPI001E3CB468|nr:helix-turn-helix domain-containing protein [Agrilactobacillus fermenti]MCD2255588.1 helix-turn-helix transcriptional regulator [Agrilactobacillus fermenti]
MKRHIYDCQAGCPVESTLQIIAGKWKSVILYHLFVDHNCHFSDLERKIKDCSHRMLAIQLAELEHDQVIAKIPTNTANRPIYVLTEFGKTLKPVITAMATWGDYYNAHMTKEAQQLDTNEDKKSKLDMPLPKPNLL